MKNFFKKLILTGCLFSALHFTSGVQENLQASAVPLNINLLIPNVGIMPKNNLDTEWCVGSLIDKNFYDFIYEGQVLDPSQKFSFYNIADGASIVAVKRNFNESENRWVRITRDCEEFNDSIRLQLGDDPREVYRLRDLQKIKRESKPKVFKKMMLEMQKKSDKMWKNSGIPSDLGARTNIPKECKMGETPLEFRF